MKPFVFLESVENISTAQATLEAARFNEREFTRNRKMPFASALSFMLDMRKTTLQTRLNQFYTHTEGGEPISQQAFSELRMKFDHSSFENMVRTTVALEYSGELNEISKILSRAVSPVRPNRRYKRVFRPFNANNHNLKSRL
jgi:hypothetical protein